MSLTFVIVFCLFTEACGEIVDDCSTCNATGGNVTCVACANGKELSNQNTCGKLDTGFCTIKISFKNTDETKPTYNSFEFVIFCFISESLFCMYVE